MFNDPSMFFSVHSFLLAVAMVGLSSKHSFAISGKFECEEHRKRIKQYTYFFNASVFVGFVSLLMMLFYFIFYANADMSKVDVFWAFEHITIAQLLFLSSVLCQSFAVGPILQIIAMFGSN